MSRSRLPLRIAVLSLVALAAACSSDGSTTGPSATDAAAINADVAVQSGASIASDVAVWMGNEAAASSGFAASGAPAGGNCARSGNTMTCTGAHDGTLSVTRTVAFFDAAGAAQSQFDAATTARVDFGVQVSGSTSGAQFTSSVTRTRNESVTGLAGSETQRTWNGTGSSTMQSTFTAPSGTRTHQMTESDTTTNVVWVVAPTRGAYPASGTVVHHIAVSSTISGQRNGTFSATRRVVVTFNGTAQVPLEVSAVGPRGATRELACTLDLSTRGVSCPR